MIDKVTEAPIMEATRWFATCKDMTQSNIPAGRRLAEEVHPAPFMSDKQAISILNIASVSAYSAGVNGWVWQFEDGSQLFANNTTQFVLGSAR